MKKPPSTTGKAPKHSAFPWLSKNKQRMIPCLRIMGVVIILGICTSTSHRTLEAAELRPAYHITIDDNGLSYSLQTYRTTIKSVLEESNISIGEKDTVYPPLDSRITSDYTTISITRYTEPVKEKEDALAQTGIASWYAKGLPNPYAHTAASRDFPRGTRLLVTDSYSGKSVEVVINDYGPEAWTGRMIDLSLGAFRQIANPSMGLSQTSIIELP